MASTRNWLVSIVTRSIVCLAVLALAITIFARLFGTRPMPAVSNSDDAAPGVLVMKARPVPVARRWNGFGTARAMDSANVPARVSATVVEVPVNIEPGARVARGDVLARLDDSDFTRQVEIATQSIADIDSQLARLEVELTSWTERTELAAEQVELAQAEFDRAVEAMRRGAAKQREVDLTRQ
ncbi:MAG: HlyD family secretion protein, partial [Planctomycetota bacterium]